MFRVVLQPIIRSAYNCIYSIWYLSHRYCYLLLSWKCWNGVFYVFTTFTGISLNVNKCGKPRIFCNHLFCGAKFITIRLCICVSYLDGWMIYPFMDWELLNTNVNRVNSNGRYSVHYRPYASQLKICCLVTHCTSEPLGRKVTTTLTL
jgi:hypothetical protein